MREQFPLVENNDLDPSNAVVNVFFFGRSQFAFLAEDHHHEVLKIIQVLLKFELLLSLHHHYFDKSQHSICPYFRDQHLRPQNARPVLDHRHLERKLVKCGLADVAQIQFVGLELEVFSQHVEFLIPTFVLLGMHRLGDLVLSLRISANQIETRIRPLVGDSFLAVCRHSNLAAFVLQHHTGILL